MIRFLFKLYFVISGWRVNTVTIPKKCVMVAIPHTSNWDFIYSMGSLLIMDSKTSFTIKKMYTKFPFNLIFNPLGAISIDHSKTGVGKSKQISEILKSNDEMRLMVTPEGQRNIAKKWKSGFYWSAVEGNVPIGLAYLDYKGKRCGLLGVVNPTGNYEEDMKTITKIYQENINMVNPKYPEKFSFDERFI